MVRPSGSAKLLRAMNESAALGHLLDGGSLTRNDLRELTGLSKPTTSEVLRRLTEAGLAVVTGHTSGGPGPNAEIYAANPDAAYAVAASLRETVVTPRPALAVALSDLTGTTRARAELAVDLDGGSLAETIRAAIGGPSADAGVPGHRRRPAGRGGRAGHPCDARRARRADRRRAGRGHRRARSRTRRPGRRGRPGRRPGATGRGRDRDRYRRVTWYPDRRHRHSRRRVAARRSLPMPGRCRRCAHPT